MSGSLAQQREFEYQDSILLDDPEKQIVETYTGDDEVEVEVDESFDIVPDTTLVTRNVNLADDSISALRNRKGFLYMKNIDSLLKASEKNSITFNRNAGKSLSLFERVLNSPLLKIIFWLIAAAFVIFIAVRLLSTHGIFRRASSKHGVEEFSDAENMNSQSDYNRLIHQSCLLGDYRSAVKYLFLRTLQVLTEYSLIDYATDKTNYRYLQEITPSKKSAFARLVLNYEYIWYGKVPVERDMYEKLEKEFTEFQNEIIYR